MGAPHRVLIVGCGAIAGGYDADRPAGAGPLTHVAAYRQHGGFRLVACVDPDAERRATFAERWGIEHAVATIAEASDVGPFEVVSICSPTSFHAEHIEAALATHPKLIFAEKPLTENLESSVRLVAACDLAGVMLAVNYTRRWAPDVVRLRDELAAGLWGAVRAAHGVYNKGILNNGSHLVDLVQFLLGPLRLVASGRPVHDYWPSDPTIPAILETGGGVPVTLAVAHAADYALFELTLVTARGVVTMEDGGRRWRRRAAVDSPIFSGYRALAGATEVAGEYDRAMAEAIGEIDAALTSGGRLSSSGASAVAAQQICESIRAAARTDI